MGKGKKKSKRTDTQVDLNSPTKRPVQQQVSGRPPQQISGGEPQRRWVGPPEQQVSGGLPQQGWERASLQPTLRGPPKQQGSRGPNEQQQWSKPPQQQARGRRSQEHVSAGPSQQQAWGRPSQEHVSAGPPQQQAWGRPSQEHISAGPSQQQAWGRPSQEHVSAGPPQQQIWGRPYQEHVSAGPSQQQIWERLCHAHVSAGLSQQQIWGRPSQEHVSAGPSQQQIWGRPYQEHVSADPSQQQAWGRPSQEHVSAGLSQQQIWGRPSQEHVSAGPPQQQIWGRPYQEHVSAGPSQQQIRGRPPQEHVSAGRSRQQIRGRPSQEHVSAGPSQQQTWGRPSQEHISGRPSQQQASGRPSQYQASRGDPPQQQAREDRPQRQHVDSKQEAPQTSLQQTMPPQTSPQRPTSTEEGLKTDQQLMDEIPKKPAREDRPQRQHVDSKQEAPQTSLQQTMPPQTSPQRPTSTEKGLKTDQQLMDEMPKKVLSVLPYSNRPGVHTVVETNMFKLNFPSNFETRAVHYDVIITPEKPKYLFRRVFEKFRETVCPHRYPAFDGKKNAYSARELPFGDQSPDVTVTVTDMESNREDKSKTFVVCLKKASVLDLSWLRNYSLGLTKYEKTQKDLQALDIILRHGPALRYTTVGRSLFFPPQPNHVISLTNGLDLWVGTFSAVVIGSIPYLNVDVAHKGFPTEQSVTRLMEELGVDLRNRSIYDALLDKITNYLKGLKVQYEIPGQPASRRTYRVNGLVDCARNNRFKYENSFTTVEEYFAQHKNYRLQYPFLPCLWVGSTKITIHVPAELCTVIGGQVIQKKMDDSQTKVMVRRAATIPELRKRKILDGFGRMNLNNQPTLMNEFHLSVRGEFEKVPARVLTAPTLYYQRPVSVSKGVWHVGEFLEKCELPDGSWTILNLDKYTRDNDLRAFQEKLIRGGSALRMAIGRPSTPFQNLAIQRDNRAIISYFETAKTRNIQMVIVIIPASNNAYSCVKQISELRIRGGIVTQCVKAYTLKKKLTDATISNILLKINSKLNGVNHVLNPEQLPDTLRKSVCMIVGADVTHPSPDSTTIPSIAAVASSTGTEGFKYRIALRFQPPREEMIQDLEKIMVEHLMAFEQQTKNTPTQIIFYRDGVSETDIPRVMRTEVSAIRRAIASLHKSESPNAIRLMFVVVQKRHHVRFFPTDVRMTDDRNCNVQAGTIVDTEITHPNHVDFYLVSHASIQGTARPTKYKCLCNDSDLSEDEIQQLTYYLCHMFARCTRSVSYPAPTYYAHLAAFRARNYINEVSVDLNNLHHEQKAKLNVQLTTNSPMFFV